MTFREKTLVAQILSILVVYGAYTIQLWGRAPTPGGAFRFLIGATVLMSLIGIVSHVVLALRHTPENADERDRAVQLRGSRNAYPVLAVGTWCVLMLALIQTSYGMLSYAIIGVFALAELVRLGSQLVYYRIAS